MLRTAFFTAATLGITAGFLWLAVNEVLDGIIFLTFILMATYGLPIALAAGIVAWLVIFGTPIALLAMIAAKLAYGLKQRKRV